MKAEDELQRKVEVQRWHQRLELRGLMTGERRIGADRSGKDPARSSAQKKYRRVRRARPESKQAHVAIRACSNRRRACSRVQRVRA